MQPLEGGGLATAPGVANPAILLWYTSACSIAHGCLVSQQVWPWKAAAVASVTMERSHLEVMEDTLKHAMAA